MTYRDSDGREVSKEEFDWQRLKNFARDLRTAREADPVGVGAKFALMPALQRDAWITDALADSGGNH